MIVLRGCGEGLRGGVGREVGGRNIATFCNGVSQLLPGNSNDIGFQS